MSWDLTCNANANSATDFVATTDNQRIDPQGDMVGRYTDAQGTFHGYFLPHQCRPKK